MSPQHKILIVEDSGATREFLRQAAEQLGELDVYTVATGYEALKALPRHQFELIITDIHMPDFDGLELINFVKRNPHYRQTPLVVVTSSADCVAPEIEKGYQLGASEYLRAPVESAAVCDLIRRYLHLE